MALITDMGDAATLWDGSQNSTIEFKDLLKDWEPHTPEKQAPPIVLPCLLTVYERVRTRMRVRSRQ